MTSVTGTDTFVQNESQKKKSNSMTTFCVKKQTSDDVVH